MQYYLKFWLSDLKCTHLRNVYIAIWDKGQFFVIGARLSIKIDVDQSVQLQNVCFVFMHQTLDRK